MLWNCCISYCQEESWKHHIHLLTWPQMGTVESWLLTLVTPLTFPILINEYGTKNSSRTIRTLWFWTYISNYKCPIDLLLYSTLKMMNIEILYHKHIIKQPINFYVEAMLTVALKLQASFLALYHSIKQL